MKSAANYNFFEFYIPSYMAEGVERWIENGVYPGGFLTAVIENDLFKAISNADETNRRNIPAYCGYFYNEAPAGCYGSVEIAKRWNEIGGLKGLAEKNAVAAGDE